MHARAATLVAAVALRQGRDRRGPPRLGDHDGLAAEAVDAAASGFAATACIHPSQVPVIREAYRPAPEQVAWARAVLAAAPGERGAFQYEGRLVDGPVIKHAAELVRRADRAGAPTPNPARP